MSDLFDHRPALADDVHVRESSAGPLLFRRGSRQSFVLSPTEMGAVACMDGSLTLEAIAAKVLVRHGQTTYAGLVQLYQALAAAGFLRDPAPHLGVIGPRIRFGWIFDLPILPIPGLGRAVPPLPHRLTRPAAPAAVALIAALLSLPAFVALLRDPAGSATVGGSWEAAVLALWSTALFASLCRAIARAAWLRRHEAPLGRFDGGLRLRYGLLAFAAVDPTEHLRTPTERASLGRAGLLGLFIAAACLALATPLLPPTLHSAAPYLLVPWLLVFLELCPFVATSDGAHLLAPAAHTPAARAAIAAALMRPTLPQALAALARRDHVATSSALWLAAALLLLLGAPGPATSAWADHLRATDNLPLSIAGAIPFIAWAALGAAGVLSGLTAFARRAVLAIELRRGALPSPRPSLPDDEADRVLLSMPPLGVLPQTRRRGEAERLVTRVVRPAENLGADSARALYAVAAGSFTLTCPGSAPVQFGPGDVFLGQMRAIGADAPADVIAQTAGRLRVLSAEAVDRLLGEIPEARGALSETLLSRAALRSCLPLATLPAHAFELLLARAESMVVAPGAPIHHDPRAPATLYLVRGGSAADPQAPPGTPAARPGDLLGLDSLFGGPDAHRTWIATSRCHLLRLPIRGLADVLQRAAGVGLALEAATLTRTPARSGGRPAPKRVPAKSH